MPPFTPPPFTTTPAQIGQAGAPVMGPPSAPGQFGLAQPGPTGPTPAPASNVVQLGVMRAVPLATLQQREADEAAATARQQAPLVTGIAAHIRQFWSVARDAKRNSGIEERLLRNMRARRSEYDPDKAQAIKEMGGSDVYVGITGVKCRAASSWITDVMMGTGEERPWSIKPTPVPDLPPEINDLIVAAAAKPLQQAAAMGQEPDQDQAVQVVSNLRDQALAAVKEEAVRRADRMADKMEDQLLQGGFLEALDAFVDDVVTFPTAILKGPVIRRKPVLSWGPNNQPIVGDQLVLEWERVSPFDFYPCPTMETVQQGALLQKHRLSRDELQQLKGVDGYDSGAIDKVLVEHRTGLSSWLFDTAQEAEAKGQSSVAWASNPDQLIDALQYWGTVQGQLLLDWGMDKKQVPDPTKEYHVEAWLIGSYVIKAVLNYDPLCRKPYYTASYEKVPGSIWGNGVADLVRDPQVIANATARALVNNMSMASGPQVGVKVDRLAAGEKITQMTPWRIWQMTTDPVAGSTDKALEFFQPDSNAQELMAVFANWSDLADEYSGIPKYLTGDSSGGAGRTASGLSMLISNAGKSIKQVIGNLDVGVFKPLLERLYYHNMRYSDDPELKGDVQINARGASALIAKEAAQVRRNEFLQATANPMDFQIMGVEGRAAVLREVAKGLDMDTDKVVPSTDVLRQKAAAAAAIQQAQAQAEAQAQGGPTGATPPPGPGGPPGLAPPPVPAAAHPVSAPGQALMDGAPQVDHFTPPARG